MKNPCRFLLCVVVLGLALVACTADAFDANGEIPKYYLRYLESRLKTIQAQLQEGGDDSYAFYYITDTHPNQNYGKSGFLLSYLSKRLPIHDLIFGGDIGPSTSDKWGEGVSAYEALMKSDSANTRILHSVRPVAKVYRVKGNHDYSVADADYWVPDVIYTVGTKVVYRPHGNDDGGLWRCIYSNSDHEWNPSHWQKVSDVSGYTIDAQVSRSMIMHDAIMNGDIVSPSNVKGCYYYFDRPDAKLRIICLDTCDTDYGYYGISNVYYGITDEQFNWLGNSALLTTPPDYSLIVVFHIPITENTSLSQDYVNRTYANELRSVLNGVNNKNVVSVRGYSFDFSSFTPSIKMVLNGHTHSDLVTKTNGYFAVSCIGDSYVNEANPSPLYANLNVPGNKINKKRGSIREQSFDVVVYDPQNNVIKFLKIGQGIDRYLNLSNVSVKKGTAFTIKTSLSGEHLRYYCYDANKNHLDEKSKKYTYSQSLAKIDQKGLIQPMEAGEIVVAIYDLDNDIIELTGITINN